MDISTITATISEDAISQEIGGETVILDLNGEQYFGLDSIGTRIWQLIEQHGNLQRVYDTILAEFEVDPDELESDLTLLIDQLREAELITINQVET